jgi:raffinose/stachyose/melibiose transport system permease protein
MRRTSKITGGRKFFWCYPVLLFFAVTAIAPFYLVLINSMKNHVDIVANPLAPPLAFNFENFRSAWRWGEFGKGFINGIILTGTSIIVILFCSSTMAYVLAKNRIKIVPVLIIYFMVAMTIPIQLFMFTLYSALSKLKLLGNLNVVGTLHAALYMPTAVFLMRTFFLRIPGELEEAARIDGASSWQVFTRVMLPVVSPGMVTSAIIVGLMSWNEYLLAATFLQTKNRNATLGYLSMNNVFNLNMGVMMAGALILIIPVLIFFLCVQRMFIDGLIVGSVKG